MPFGSEFAIPGIELKSADEKIFRVTPLSALGLRILGIPHLGLRYRARKISKFVGNKKLKILDLGCGPGYYSINLAKKGHKIFGIDIDEGKLDLAKKVAKKNKLNVEFSFGDARKIPFKEETFDLVICSEIIEHIKEDKTVISEILRVLKKSGRFIITVPADSEENKQMYKKMGHVLPGYNKKLLKELFTGKKIKYEITRHGKSSLKLATRINRNFKNPILIGLTFYPLLFISLFDNLFKGEANSIIIRGRKLI